MAKLALILPYFGQWPDWFPLYLDGLARMDFDVLCFTDLQIGEHPANFIVKRMSIGEMRTLAERKLGIPVNLVWTRKLCDLKPMYGHIFEDFITGYDYWAYGDCDLVYGVMLNDVLKGVLAGEHDVISFRRCWMSGPFCILKNTPSMRLLYREAGDLVRILASPWYEFFDELGGDWFGSLLAGRMSVEECGRRRKSFSAVLWRQTSVSFFHEDVLSEDALLGGETIEMRSGKLTRNGREIPVFHFVNSKKAGSFRIGFRMCGQKKVSDYRITRVGFFAPEDWTQRFRITLCREVWGGMLDLRAFIRCARGVAWRRLAALAKREAGR